MPDPDCACGAFDCPCCGDETHRSTQRRNRETAKAEDESLYVDVDGSTIDAYADRYRVELNDQCLDIQKG